MATSGIFAEIQSSTDPQDINNKLLNKLQHVQNQTLDKLYQVN